MPSGEGLVAPGRLYGITEPGLGQPILREQPTDMSAIEIDMRSCAPKPVISFRFEGQGLRVFEECSGPGFDLFAKGLLGGAFGAVARFRTVPANQAKPDPLRAAVGQALQLKRIAIDRHHIPHGRADTARSRTLAEIIGVRRQITLRASGGQGELESNQDAHRAT